MGWDEEIAWIEAQSKTYIINPLKQSITLIIIDIVAHLFTGT